MTLFAQARFPAPEFENYTVPPLHLESFVYDSIWWRVALLVAMLVATGLCFYRFRSRGALSILSVIGLIVFGYVFTACPCPVGMFQNVAGQLASREQIPLALALLFTIPPACALFFGRLFCAAACPLGAVQEILHWKTLTVPRPLDRVLRMVPVALLALLSVMAACGMGYPLCELDPYLPLFLLSFPPAATVTLIVFVLLGLFVSRPFCRYCCPYGALLRFFSIFAYTRPRITTKTCIRCRLCEQGCPNGAVVAPDGAMSLAVQRSGTRRISFLIACIPLALFCGGALGCLAAPLVSSQHRNVRLLGELERGEETDAVKAFDSSGTSAAELRERAARAVYHIRIGMTLAGIFFAACLMVELIAEARRRPEESEYSIDRSLCFCCGRCYRACPLNGPTASREESASREEIDQ